MSKKANVTVFLTVLYDASWLVMDREKYKCKSFQNIAYVPKHPKCKANMKQE